MPDVDVVSIGLLCLVILLGGLLLYVLSILKGIQSDNASQRSTLDEIKTQNAVQKEAIDNLDTDVKQEVITAGIAASGEVLKGAVAGTMKDLKISVINSSLVGPYSISRSCLSVILNISLP